MTPDIQDPVWTAYLLGDLTETERAEAEKLLQSHPDLRREVDHLNETLQEVKDVLTDAPDAYGLEPLRAEAVRREAGGGTARSHPAMWVPTAFAALLAVGFGLAHFLQQPPQVESDGLNLTETEAIPDDIQPALLPEGSADAMDMDSAADEVQAPAAALQMRAAPEESRRSDKGAAGRAEKSGFTTSPTISRKNEHIIQAPAGKDRALSESREAGPDSMNGLTFGQSAAKLEEKSLAEEEDTAPTATPTPTRTPTPTPLPVPQGG